MGGAGVEVNTRRTTQRLSRLAGQSALASRTDSTTLANRTTSTTVSVVGLKVYTLSAAVFRSREAAQDAVSVHTSLSTSASTAACAAVLEVRFQVHARLVARVRALEVLEKGERLRAVK